MKKSKLSFATGFLAGSIFFSGIAFAASQTISVNFLPIKFLVDGKLKETNDAFLYKGVPYAPVSFVGQAVGKQVTWDAKVNTVTIQGDNMATGEATRLSSIPYKVQYGYSSSTFVDNWDKGSFTAGGTVYEHGLGYDNIDDVANDRYSSTRQAFATQLAGKYSRFTGTVAVDDQSPNKTSMLVWRIKGDGKVLFDSARMKAGQSQNVDISVKGVKVLELEMRKVTGNGSEKDMWAFIGNALLQ